MRSSDQQDPETARLRRGSAPIPRTTIVCGAGAPVKASLRRAKMRRGLDRGLCPAKKTLLRRGNGSSLDWAPISQPAVRPPVGRPRDLGGQIGG